MTTLPASAAQSATKTPRTMRTNHAVLMAIIAALAGGGGGNLLSRPAPVSPLTSEQSTNIAKVPAIETKVTAIEAKVIELERSQDRRDAKLELMLDRIGRLESASTQIVGKIDMLIQQRKEK